MKPTIVVLLFVFCYTECIAGRKTYAPIDKNANLAFINMEGGGVRSDGSARPTAPADPAAPATPTAPKTPPKPASPAQPTPQPITIKPPVAPPQPKPAPPPAKPTQPPQIQPKPIQPTPASNRITTPGPGSVKQLINYYDSQGKASPIRPYSYSQSVKQG